MLFVHQSSVVSFPPRQLWIILTTIPAPLQDSFHGTSRSLIQHTCYDNQGTARITVIGSAIWSGSNIKIVCGLPQYYTDVHTVKTNNTSPNTGVTAQTELDKENIWLKAVEAIEQKYSIISHLLSLCHMFIPTGH